MDITHNIVELSLTTELLLSSMYIMSQEHSGMTSGWDES